MLGWLGEAAAGSQASKTRGRVRLPVKVARPMVCSAWRTDLHKSMSTALSGWLVQRSPEAVRAVEGALTRRAAGCGSTLGGEGAAAASQPGWVGPNGLYSLTPLRTHTHHAQHSLG